MKLLNLPSTLNLCDLAPSEICRKHLKTGYRRAHQPLSYYVLSMLQVNNQTINVWTHIIGFLFIAYRAYGLSLTFDFVNDPTARPLGAGLVGMIIILACSSFAHTFSERSEQVHCCCFFVDFAAISIYCMTCSVMSHAYFVRDKSLGTFLVAWSRPVSVYLAVQYTVMSCFTKIWLPREHWLRKSLQAAAGLLLYLWIVLPLIYRYLWPCHRDNTLALHVHHVILFHISVLVYAAHIPERLFPGTFDFIGHSHNIHHILQVMTANSYINVTIQEIRSHRNLIQHMATVQDSYSIILTAIYINLIVIAMATVCVVRKVTPCVTKDNSVTREDLSGYIFYHTALISNAFKQFTHDNGFDLSYNKNFDKTQ